MKHLLLTLVAVGLAATSVAAQDPLESGPSADAAAERSPEYYMLKMMERYDDPKQMIQRRAAQKAADRRGRLASQKWYGFSPSRPMVNPAYGLQGGQQWIGNGWNPHQWVHDTHWYPIIIRSPVER